MADWKELPRRFGKLYSALDNQALSRPVGTVEVAKTECKKVTRTFKHNAYEIVKVDLADATRGNIVESLRGTPTHPFFTSTGMVAMGELKPEMKVITRRGPPLEVKSVTREAHPEGVDVYNLEVEGDHTYFVGTAQGGAWVHNDCAGATLGDLSGLRLSAILKKLEEGGFAERPVAPGSNSPYRTFLHPDGSKVSIDTANKVAKVNGPRIWESAGARKFAPRIGPHNQPYIDE